MATSEPSMCSAVKSSTETDSEDKAADISHGPIALGFGDAFPMETSTSCTDNNYVNDTSCTDNNYVNDTRDTSSSVTYYRQDVKDPLAVRGKCGLYNLGNTCFMNSGLQCLMSTVPLVRFLLNYDSPDKTERETMLGQFKHLFFKIWSGRFSLIYPRDFKQVLGLFYPQFQDYRQHDCQEFLALLLDALHEQLNIRKTDFPTSQLEVRFRTVTKPMDVEPSMNNMSATSLSVEGKRDSVEVDQSHSTCSTHSGLTFDNMKLAQEGINLSNDDDSPTSVLRDSKCSQKNRNRSSLGKMSNLISEDFDQATGSEHSSDFEQCSVIQNLCLHSSPVEKSVFDLPDEVKDMNNGKVSATMGEVSATMGEVSDNVDENFSEAVMQDDDEEEEEKMVECGESLSEKKIGNDGISAEKNGVTVVLNNTVGKAASAVPSLEDLYAKETKTLNTNVLASEYLQEIVTMDSDKYVKQDNIHRPDVLEEVDRISSLNNVLEASGKKDDRDEGGPSRIKDVNIRADKKSRYSKGACGPSTSMEADSEECFAFNNIKRMKFEGTEKNLQMQEMTKINKTRILFGNLRHQSDVESESDGEEMDADVEMSDDDEASSVSEAAIPVSREGESYNTSDLLAAEESWNAYLTKNDSIIVGTFQGQFKSTVICSECNHLSVTFEPFMYLSVPIPHAMERQFCVTFVPIKGEPTRYLFVINKLEKVSSLKKELCELIGNLDYDILLAEVLDWHISRILEENTMLRYINDATRKLYAFEMEPYLVETEDEMDSSQQQAGANCLPNNSDMTKTNNADIFSKMEPFSLPVIPNETLAGQTTPETQKTETEIFSEFVNQTTPPGNRVDQSSSSFNAGNQSNTSMVDDLKNYELAGTAMWEWSEGDRAGSNRNSGEVWQTLDSGNVSLASTADVEQKNVEETCSSNVGGDNRASTAPSENWRSCAICLEELTDNELMIHTSCGGTFCPTCLEMSVQHYGEASYCCPVCSSPAVMSEDFVPLASAASHKPKTRLVTIPLTFRCDTDVTSAGLVQSALFTHPNILHLPSNLSGEYIYNRIDSLLTAIPGMDYKIVLTDGQGLHCARCLYMEHCSGCQVTRDGTISLRPGDHLTVHVNCISDKQIKAAQGCHDDKSMEKQRSDKPVTLYDCLRAFTQSEDLDEHWFCPECQRNQYAKKTMTVWQYPDTVIIHLKRFMFHELASTKVDSKVVSPIDNLDLEEFISGPHTKLLQYSLSSQVCHFGGVNSGHYTSYAKHPVDGKWYYYNDETVSPQSPGEDDFCNTYVLLYQRKGTDLAVQIPDDLELINTDSDHMTDHVPANSLPGTIMLPAAPQGEELILKKPTETFTSDKTEQQYRTDLDFYS